MFATGGSAVVSKALEGKKKEIVEGFLVSHRSEWLSVYFDDHDHITFFS